MDPATGTPVAKLMSLPEQLYLTNSEFRYEDYDSTEFSSEFSRSFRSAAATASHQAGQGGGGGGHHQAVVSSTGRCYYLSTKRSGGSLGEVLAAIPFNWEEAPGRPKVSRSRKSSRGSAGGGATDQFFDNCGQSQRFPPRPKPARTRPPLHARRQSFVSFHLNARLQAEQLLATPPPGASSLEYNNKGAGAEDPLIDPVLPLPPRLRLGTPRLMAADSSQDQFQHRYDRFLGVEERLPNGPRVDHRRTQSTMAYPTNRGHRRAWSLSYPAIEQPAEPRSSKEAAISSGRVEDFESTRPSVAAAVGGDGSKDFWPSLKETMRWRNAKLAGITLHRYLAKRFPQDGRGKNKNKNKNKGDDKNNENCNWPGYFHVLESSPQHRSSRFSDKVEKKNVDHGGGGGARGGRGGLPISRGNRSAAPSSHFSTRSAYAAAPAISGRHNRYTTEFPATGADRRFDRAITFPRTRKQRLSAVSSSRFSRASRAWLSSPVRCCYNFPGITSLGYESP